MSNEETTNKVQNGEASVENIVLKQTNETVERSLKRLYRDILSFDEKPLIATILTNEINKVLEEKSFMTDDVKLTPMQTEIMKEGLETIVRKSYSIFVDSLSKDKRTEHISDCIRGEIITVIYELFKNIGQDINRGACINGNAVMCNSTNEDYNKVEIRYPNRAGDITIPSYVVIISTNCVEMIKEASNDIREKYELDIEDKTSSESKSVLKNILIQ